MKKLMLGTTALIAASALTAGTASAADPIKLALGGYYHSGLMFTDYDDDLDEASAAVRQDGEVFFTGSTTLDNGLKFGVNLQLETNQSGDQMDETYMFVEGSFGRINVGEEDQVGYLMHIWPPSPVGQMGMQSATFNSTGVNLSSAPGGTGDQPKISYFSPRFAGFQLGGSWTPDATTGLAASGGTILDADGSSAYAVAMNYIQAWNDFGLKASASYQHFDHEVLEDENEWGVAATVSFSGLAVGAGYKRQNDLSGVADTDQDNVSVGVTYGMGPWKVGAQYNWAEMDVSGTENEADGILIGGQYTLGPGITVWGGVQLLDSDTDYSTTDKDGDTTNVMIGTTLSF